MLFALVIVGALLFGFFTMTDPPPEHAVPEPSPAFVGEGDVPEVSPAQP